MDQATKFHKSELASIEAAARGLDELVRDPAQIVHSVRQTPDLQTEHFSWRLLRHAAALRDTIDLDTTRSFIQGALVALQEAGSRNHVLLCRAWLDLASIEMMRSQFAAASAAIEHAQQHAATLGDREFYTAVIDHSRAALLYSTERDEEAAGLLESVISTFEHEQDVQRAALARRLLMYVEFRRDRVDVALQQFQRDARLAHCRHDDQDLANLYRCIAACHLLMDQVDDAEQAIEAARHHATNLGADLIEALIEQTAAMITIRRDGIPAGLRRLEQVRERCFELKVPGEAVICLLNAVDIIAKQEPHSDVLPELCRIIQREASRLSLTVSVATATERLHAAAQRGEPLPPFVRDVRSMIKPNARLVADEVAN